MLEPYVDHPSIREKIILVSSGFKAPEIAELPFTTVMWPNVFTPTVAPRAVSVKIARNARERQIAKTLSKSNVDRDKSARTRAVEPAPRAVALSDLLQPWDVHCALARYFGMGTLRFNDLKSVECASCNNPHADMLVAQAID